MVALMVEMMASGWDVRWVVSMVDKKAGYSVAQKDKQMVVMWVYHLDDSKAVQMAFLTELSLESRLVD